MEMGADAIRKLLAGLDLEALNQELRAQVKVETSGAAQEVHRSSA